MFTSSFACTSLPAIEAITSLAFMFDDVPEPVWKTSIGNWSSSSPFAICCAAAAMRSALSWSSSPSSALTRAAAPLMRPSQRATGAGIGSPDTGKLAIAFVVSPPQSCLFSVVAMQPSVVGAGWARPPWSCLLCERRDERLAVRRAEAVRVVEALLGRQRQRVAERPDAVDEPVRAVDAVRVVGADRADPRLRRHDVAIRRGARLRIE